MNNVFVSLFLITITEEHRSNSASAPPPPPSYEPVQVEQTSKPSGAKKLKNNFIISKSEAFEALSDHIDRNCCWGTWPLKKMTIVKIVPSTSYKYLITSWNERRRTDPYHKAYYGGTIDGPENGTPPGLWDIVPWQLYPDLFKARPDFFVAKKWYRDGQTGTEERSRVWYDLVRKSFLRTIFVHL